jgi:hypothetical protein
MKVVNEIDATCRVSAGLEDDGTTSVKVFAQAEYAEGRPTTVEVAMHELPSELVENVRVALDAVREAAGPLLGKRIPQAISTSLEVAARFKEL